MSGEYCYLRKVKDLRAQSDPINEADTVELVSNILQKCFRWKQARIRRESNCTRGFIDLELKFPNKNVKGYVEVKAWGKQLKEEQITKYLGHDEDFVIGALTNYGEWWVYLAGSQVKKLTGNNTTRIACIKIKSRQDIKHLERFVGYSVKGTEERLLATLGENRSVITKLLCEDGTVLKVIRAKVRDLIEDCRMVVCVPQFATLGIYVQQLLSGYSIDGCPISRAKLRKVIGDPAVSDAIHRILQDTLGSRNNNCRVRSTIRQMLKNRILVGSQVV